MEFGLNLDLVALRSIFLRYYQLEGENVEVMDFTPVYGTAPSNLVGLRINIVTEDKQPECLESGQVHHGVDCEKEPHYLDSGYLHGENDDSPFNDDGVSYCGRCHVCLP